MVGGLWRIKTVHIYGEPADELIAAARNARKRIHELQGHTITPELDAALAPFEGIE
jgi:hypothetical protein